MRLVIQRVAKASVSVLNAHKPVGVINAGLLVLVGIKKGDTQDDARVLSEKLSKLRVMADRSGKMNLSSSEFLIVSQFTLYADTSRGNRPSFAKAEDPEKARKLYDYFAASLRDSLPGKRVETGSFGDYMEISTQLDGPATIILES